MKGIKKLSLILAATFTLGGAVMANEAREGKRSADPKQRAEKMTERMAKEYNLTDTQKKQLLEVNQAFAEKMGERPAHHKNVRKGKSGEWAKADKDKKDKKDKESVRGDRERRKNRPDAPKFTAEQREKRMQEMKQVRDNYNTELQKIMSTEQYQAFAKKQAERAQKREERGEKMKENRTKKFRSEKSGKEA